MDTTRKHPNYIAVWGALFVLTVLEVGAVYLKLPRHLLVTALLLLAAWKALLVALYFMHLRSESRLVWGFALTPIAFLVLIVAGTLADTLFR